MQDWHGQPSDAPGTRVSDRPWKDVHRSSYASAQEYCAACLIDENPAGATMSKSRCKLPVYEPQALGGLLNRNAVRAAADRLLSARHGVSASVEEKHAAALRLLQLYARIGESPPAGLLRLAESPAPQSARAIHDSAGERAL